MSFNLPKGSVLGVLNDGRTIQQAFDDLVSASVITPEKYGAKGDGITDDRVAIQSAIDEAATNFSNGSGSFTVRIDNKYSVSLNPASVTIPGEVSAARAALCIKPGVSIEGNGILSLVDTYTGTSSGAVITNWLGSADNCSVKGITIDCKYKIATGRGISGINIVDSKNVIIDGVKVFNGSGGGIYLRKSRGFEAGDYGCVRSKIVNCIVDNTYYIGIQCERPDGMIIANNNISNTGDNGIDIEGNNTATTFSGFANNVVITGNELTNVKNGIFIESCGNTNIVGNHINTAGVGIVYNRINSGSFYNICTGNVITGTVNTAGMGIRFINQIGRCHVSDNLIRVKNIGMHFADRIDRCNIGVNTFESIGSTILAFDKVP